MAVMSRSQKPGRTVPVDERFRVVLAVPAHGGTVAERRLRSENEQLKLALAEQMVQLRLWQKGAEHIEDVPSVTSKP
jgi:hypothetical protein